MTRLRAAKIVSLIVIASGMLVIAGWLLDISVLKSIHSHWVTMKFVTALSFVLAGLILFFIVQFEEGKRKFSKVWLPVLGFTLFILMATLLLAMLAGMSSGIEELFLSQGEDAMQITFPGRISIGTILNFIFISIIPFLYTFQLKPPLTRVRQCGWIIGLSGFLGITGYIFSFPLLYYSIEGLSTAMAFHAALLFILLGFGFVFASRKEMAT